MYLTTAETARALGATVRTIQIWFERGQLKGGKTPGGHRRISIASVIERAQVMGVDPNFDADSEATRLGSALYEVSAEFSQHLVMHGIKPDAMPALRRARSILGCTCPGN